MPAADQAGKLAGVTRLAEITYLDRIGLPIWQAIRPMSRALSVHQGKGSTDAEAQMGAYLEAFESHSAESFDADGPFCPYDALPVRRRAPCPGDFAADRDRPYPADEPCRWVEAESLRHGEPLYLPWDCVSLDLTCHVPSPFDRASNGVAAGASREEAIRVALNELIERDAVIEWKAKGMLHCIESELNTDTVPYDWFQMWRERVEGIGAAIRLYVVPSITGSPVFACEISDMVKEGTPYRSMQGGGCHSLPEVGLFKALAEAIQGRATYIAGAREDLPLADYAPTSGYPVAFGLPQPPGMKGMDFGSIPLGPSGLDALVDALDGAGYGRIAVVDLADTGVIWAVRAFVTGLGSSARRRRAPLPS